MLAIRSIGQGVTILLILTNKSDGAAVKELKDFTMAIDTDTSIYYDPGNRTKLVIDKVDGRFPFDPTKLIVRGLPCFCNNLVCGCCTGINLMLLNFDRVACTNLTFVPEEFALDFVASMGDDIIMDSRLTARNPPPFCVPLQFLPIVSFCVRFFDLHLKDRKFNVCVDFETRVGQFTVFILHFNCVKLSSDGVSWSRPAKDTSSLGANSSEPRVYDSLNSGDAEEDRY
ncbi:uncharacterized protein [Venturia canescens]|uniref:uncharacterized protein n=1 Tax=Venturia canescens TaxID=32260 RepID=UPI001C9C17B2|nr:uncharacterized protein LOC122413174 [Venturia canescens]